MPDKIKRPCSEYIEKKKYSSGKKPISVSMTIKSEIKHFPANVLVNISREFRLYFILLSAALVTFFLRYSDRQQSSLCRSVKPNQETNESENKSLADGFHNLRSDRDGSDSQPY
jgi:hypothetical protein